MKDHFNDVFITSYIIRRLRQNSRGRKHPSSVRDVVKSAGYSEGYTEMLATTNYKRINGCWAVSVWPKWWGILQKVLKLLKLLKVLKYVKTDKTALTDKRFVKTL